MDFVTTREASTAANAATTADTFLSKMEAESRLNELG
jgi:hypothetical protein